MVKLVRWEDQLRKYLAGVEEVLRRKDLTEEEWESAQNAWEVLDSCLATMGDEADDLVEE